jgi:hypothetical protein
MKTLFADVGFVEAVTQAAPLYVSQSADVDQVLAAFFDR